MTEGFLRRMFNVYLEVFPYKVSVKTLPFPVHKTSVNTQVGLCEKAFRGANMAHIRWQDDSQTEKANSQN